MKTKYIKVSVSKRTPEKRDYFHTNKGKLVFLPFAGWYRGCMKVDDPEHWLEEVPDMEEEMREMLEEIRDGLIDLDLHRIKELEDYYVLKINRLLNPKS